MAPLGLPELPLLRPGLFVFLQICTPISSLYPAYVSANEHSLGQKQVKSRTL